MKLILADILAGQELLRFSSIADTVWAIERNEIVNFTPADMSHPLVQQLQAIPAPGVIFATSGSTGKPKYALHDLRPMLAMWRAGKPRRVIAHMALDHIGGFNTIMHTLYSGGELIFPPNSSVSAVCTAIQNHKAEVLPTTPSFLRLLLAVDHRHWDLSSLKLITYGTEPMHESTLQQLAKAFPGVQLKQTYGLSELGIFRTKSRGNDSTWLKLGDDTHQVQVRDGILWVKAKTAMLGYLNAPYYVDPEGWYSTGDRVETDGEWYRILGRASELINVGGLKVHPAEIENHILAVEGVADCTISSEPNYMLGHAVTCTLWPQYDYVYECVRDRVKEHCKQLDRYKRPMKYRQGGDDAITERWKKRRV